MYLVTLIFAKSVCRNNIVNYSIMDEIDCFFFNVDNFFVFQARIVTALRMLKQRLFRYSFFADLTSLILNQCIQQNMKVAFCQRRITLLHVLVQHSCIIIIIRLTGYSLYRHHKVKSLSIWFLLLTVSVGIIL